MYLSKNHLELLQDCDCGQSGACCPASHQEALARILVASGHLLRVGRLTFRTTDKGRRAMKKAGIEPLKFAATAEFFEEDGQNGGQ